MQQHKIGRRGLLGGAVATAAIAPLAACAGGGNGGDNKDEKSQADTIKETNQGSFVLGPVAVDPAVFPPGGCVRLPASGPGPAEGRAGAFCASSVYCCALNRAACRAIRPRNGAGRGERR